MKRYRNRNPHWLTARYAGTCSHPDCQQPIRPGDQIYYYPQGRAAFATECGHAEAEALEQAAQQQDEKFNPCL